MLEQAPARQTSFVGRQREVDAVTAALDLARESHGRFVLVTGDAGAGKTRFCAEIATLAREADFLTLVGRCVEGESGLPYLPFVDLVEAAAASLTPEALSHALGGLAGQLAVLAPQLRNVVPEIPPPPSVPQEHERQALFSAVRDFFDRASRERPLLLMLEDLQWAEASTVLLARHLQRTISGRRILVLATCRANQPVGSGGSALDQLVADVHREPAALVVNLEDLDRDGVRAMIGSITGREPPPSVCDALYERTGGNPFFVEQIVKHLTEEKTLFDERERWVDLTSFDELAVPDSVRLVLERRLRHVDESCRRVLGVAAVIGRAADFELLVSVAEIDADACLEAVEAAERSRLVSIERRAGRLGVVFTHDLIRQTLLAQLSPPRRERLHLEVASAIERLFDNTDGGYDADLAHHYLEARSGGELEKTLRYLTAAAERAVATTAFEDAARMYSDAVGLVAPADSARRCELLLRCGEARKRVSDSDSAREAFAAAASIAKDTGDAGALARAALGYARSWPTVGTVDETAVRLLDDALAAVPDDDVALRARLTARLTLQLLYSGEPADVKRLGAEAVADSRRAGDPMTLARALQVMHAALWQPEHLEERLAIASEILDLALQIGDEGVALWGRRPRIADLMEFGDVALAEAEIGVYERGAEHTRQPMYLWQAAVRRAMLAVFYGHLDEGERLAQRELELGRQAEGQNLMAAFGGQLLVIRWLQGRLDELRALVATSRQNQPQVRLWTAVSAFIESESGRHGEARKEFDELAADRFASLPNEDTRLIVLVVASMVCATLGDGIRAEQLYELLLPYEGRNIVVSEGVACVGAASHYLGLLAATARRSDDAERHFEDAINFNTRTGGRPWLAHTQYEYARMLLTRREGGDRKRAGDLLRTSLGIARDLGLHGVQQKIEAVLRSHKRLTPDSPDGLTRREQEVLRLIARGRSTREISAELVLSERTSSRHITNIYAKIGARNRVEATAYALRRGLAD